MTIVRGWCPTAYRPMAAGDGLLVRVRPRMARLTRAQALGLAAAAIAHGNGQIDCTNRANLQIRGVTETGWPALIAALCALCLVDPDPVLERRHTLLVTPDWREGDDTHRIAEAVIARLAELPDLPGKFGFAIDAGVAPVLAGDPADIRIERGADGGLVLRADGRASGMPLRPGDEVDTMIALAEWFVESGGAVAGRMARHTAALPRWADQGATPMPADTRRRAEMLHPGAHRIGAITGLPFGRFDVRTLADLMTPDPVVALRLTPWRRVLVEGGVPAATPDNPATLDSDACVGAPGCPQATVATRAVAERLAPFVQGRLHVSGCAKGCARARPADVVLTGNCGRYDLAFAARAGDPPALAGLDAAQLFAHFGAS